MAALKNFLFVTGIVLLCLFLAWFYLRNKSLHKQHPVFQTEFFTGKTHRSERPQMIALRGESTDFPENTLSAFAAATQVDANIILWADVMMTKDGVVIVTRQQDLDVYSAQNSLGSLVPLMNWEDVQKIDAGYQFQNQESQFIFRGKGLHILSLKELLHAFPEQRFILNLADDSTGFEQQLVNTLDYNNNQENRTSRFIITSERDKILKEVKKLAPMLLYGASAPQLTQLMILSNIFLESAAPLESDLLIVENISIKFQHSERIFLNDKMIAEAHRRSMKVFAGNAISLADEEKLIAQGVDGVITSHPTALRPLRK